MKYICINRSKSYERTRLTYKTSLNHHQVRIHKSNLEITISKHECSTHIQNEPKNTLVTFKVAKLDF